MTFEECNDILLGNLKQEDNCYIWIGNLSNSGYPRLKLETKQISPSRYLSFEETKKEIKRIYKKF